MERKSLILGFIFILAGGTLTGCPDTNLNGTNSLTLHNDHDQDIFSFSVTRIGPIDPVSTKGMNLLPEPLQPGETFRVDNLVDGKYQLEISFHYFYDAQHPSYPGYRNPVQSFEGGNNYDWYFTGPKKLNADESLEPSAPTAKAILNELLGL